MSEENESIDGEIDNCGERSVLCSDGCEELHYGV